jgi:DNA-binding NtrC family response regulator
MGPNPEEPLLDVNCGALPEPLIESQLFGHVKGAFTGADQRQRGYMSAVGKGTLFLDEIAELGIALQAKLLRVLETGTFRPVGSTNDERFEGRVVSATHANLEARVADGRFREDLYYRLNVLLVRVPSLDERKEDIPILASHFLSQQPRPLHLEADGMEYLMARSWPGNVRELRNVIDRLAVFAESEVIGADDIRALEGGADKRGEDSTLRLVVRAFLRSQHPNKLLAAETALIQEALLLADGNKSLAARLLGTHRKYLERRVAKPDAEPGDAEAVDAGE